MILNLMEIEQRLPERVPVNDRAGEVAVGDRVMPRLFARSLDGPLLPSYFCSDLGGGCDGTLIELGLFPTTCLRCAALTACKRLIE